ncbi:YlxR family protein [Thermovibrio ammonificans]|jgi:predicted RNA-binding protein YlxR (DUF448 family)|uniref:YlxR domain-containing protein n=1 Tax=Thermovibrio ammonificans (strain DSM 15698 / JCM 12110 / HB-1) TaxID=648996 RepID=E8T5I9_THEA1|nr:YlxR family protein [Thermovibrio ammonificans]ADU97643.1 protein of unknown function DUF448 [Thermovibrio ammonificans HB-1]
MRRCAACRREAEKESFLRFVEFEGKPLLDVAGKLPGRGFNVCPSYGCIRQFVKRQFKGKVDPDGLYTESVKALKEYLLHLLSLAHKSGATVVGQDSIKGLTSPEGVLLFADDLSDKTKKRLRREGWLTLDGVFTSEELGNALRKERRAGAVFVERVGLGRKFYETAKKLHSLLSSR